MANAIEGPLRFKHPLSMGVTTAPFQNEEYPSATRRTDYDDFLRRNPGFILPGQIGPDWWKDGVAEADIELIAEATGAQTLRLGLEWARFEPERGKILQDDVSRYALRRYRQMIDACRDANMEPTLALNHATLPAGRDWEDKETRKAFANWARIAGQEFGDILHWVTLGEPSRIVIDGYFTGSIPPEKRSIKSALIARHHMTQASNQAYDELHEVFKEHKVEVEVGPAHLFSPLKPQDPHSLPERAYTNIANYLWNTNYMDATRNHSDFLGVDYYTGYYLNFVPRNLTLDFTARDDAVGVPGKVLLGETVRPPDSEVSGMGWPIVPDFFLDGLSYLWNKYKKPIYIEEIGCSGPDDAYRRLHMLTHMVALYQAVEDGIDVRQNNWWTGVRNLEWGHGYQPYADFGLIDLDPITGERTIRRSAALHREISQSGEIDVVGLAERYLPPELREKAYSMINGLLHVV